jgi:transposase InsO family protein
MDSRHHLPIAPNLLKQDFPASMPNGAWLADITYIAAGAGWLYLAAVLDLGTRKIVGWAMGDHMRVELPLAALIGAAQRRLPRRGSSITRIVAASMPLKPMGSSLPP